MERRSTEKPRAAVRAQREMSHEGLKPKLFNMTTLTPRPLMTPAASEECHETAERDTHAATGRDT